MAKDLEYIILSKITENMNLVLEIVADIIMYSYRYKNVEDVTKTSVYVENIRILVFNLSVVEDCVDLF